MNIRLIKDGVLIEVDESETKTTSGLIVARAPEQGGQRTGVVVAVGPGDLNESGNLVPLTVKVGDKIIFQYGTPIMIEGKNYVLAREEADVLVILQ